MSKLKVCLKCGKEYSPIRSTQKYCSKSCRTFLVISEEQKKQIEQLIIQGKSISEIETITKLSAGTLYRRIKKWGFATNGRVYETVEQHHNWKGGITYQGGYKYILDRENINARGNGYIPEHVLVMQKELNRKIESTEKIHHIDGDKLNNDISNLIILSIKEHAHAHQSLWTKCINYLIKNNLVVFNRESKEYEINE